MSTTINVRVDSDLKKESERIFKDLGFGMTTAFVMFLKAVVRNNGIPFSLEIPNEQTVKSFDEEEKISSGKKNAKKYHNVKELREDILK